MSYTKTFGFYYRQLSLSLLCAMLCLVTGIAQAQVSVTATLGTAGPTSYATLKGAFDAINIGTHKGVVTVTITASTTETATAALNASGSGAALYTRVVVKPGASATPTVGGALASLPIVQLNGSSNVMIDGSNNGSSSRDLSITNTSATTPQVVVIGSVGTTPVTGDTLKNCTIINGSQGSSAIVLSDAASLGGAGGYFNNVAIINNSVQKAYIGLYLFAIGSGTNGSGTYVAKNSLNTSGTNAIRRVGIYLQGLNGARVDSNTIGSFESASAEVDCGIWSASGTNNTIVSGNAVTGMSYSGTGAYAPVGINVSPAVTSAGMSVTGNTVTGITSSGTGTSTGIYFYSAASGALIDKNRVSNIKNTNTGGYGAAGVLLASTLTTAAVNVLNNFVWDVAAYGTNLWTSNANGNGIVADGGGGYNIYFNTVWLNTNQTASTGTRAAAVFISSNITASNSINLRNNLLINTQTVGNANSRMALVITANTNVMNTFNYNDYYSTSGNLAGQGTNPTIWNTIAQVQTNMGGNANSVSILPSFTSTTDLHLPVATNGSLNNIGVNIAAITDDIDNDTRTTTPDMGADEFGNCLPVTFTTQPSTSAFCAGGNTSLSVAATNGNQVQWQVNTGSGFSNITNGGVYAGATSNTLTITAAPVAMNGYIYRAQVSYGPGCPQTASNSVTLAVTPRPSVVVSGTGPTTFCTGGSDTLSVPAGSNVSYQWLNSSGPVTGANAASYVALTSGTYTVIATNSATGCADTSVPTVINVGSGPAAVITPGGSTAVCQGSSTILSAGTTPGVNYQWQQNGSDINGATNNNYAAASAGSYTVIVSTSPTCATTSAAVVVIVYPLPTATATSTSTAICQGSFATLNASLGTNYSYQWLSNSLPIGGATGASYTATTAATYRVIVRNTITSCRDTSVSITIKVNPLPASAITPTAPAAICERDTTLFSANVGPQLGYQWQVGSSGAIPGAINSQYKAFQSGSYAVLITDSNGCKKLSNSATLLVHPAPIAAVTYSSALEFCEGSAVGLNALEASNLSYQWIKDGADATGLTQPHQTIAVTGVYAVRVVDNFNCKSVSDPVPVTVYPKPVPIVSYNGGTLSTGSYANYQWYQDNNPIGVGGDGVAYTPATPGAYKVVVEDANGCTGTSDMYLLLALSTGSLHIADAQMLVYPNPATAFVMVENKSGLKLKRLSLMNATGAVVRQQEAGGIKERVDLTALAPGFYYLRIETDGGTLLKKLQIMP